MAKNRDAFWMRYDLKMEAESEEAEILVYSAIVSGKWDKDDPEITAKEFDEKLKAAKKAGAKRMTLRINSPGGAVTQAVAMRSMLMTAGFDELHVKIEGMCASAATLLATVPGSDVSIADGSMFMIHNPYTIAIGTAKDMEHEAEVLHKYENQFRAMYCAKCGKDEEKVRDWMDAETWFTAAEAVENGFCDSIEGEMSAAACADDLALMGELYKNMPDQYVRCALPKGEATEYKTPTEEDKEMDVKDITIEMLRSDNPALYEEIMQAGALAERERISNIDALTDSGFEEMAAEAKESGMSAMDFHMNVIKARKEKGKAFIAARIEETAPAAEIKGEEPSEPKAEEKDAAEMESTAKEVAMYAAEYSDKACGMY